MAYTESYQTRFVAVALPKEYPYVLLMAGLLAFQCLIIGMVVPGIARGKVYQNPQVQERISNLHQEYMKRELSNVKGGYPDHGNGRFSTRKMISYGQWL